MTADYDALPGIAHATPSTQTATPGRLARPSIMPRAGDTLTTAEQLDALPSLAIVIDANDEVQQRHGHLSTERGDYSAWLGVMPPTCKPSPDVALPVTVLYVPGEPSRPSVTDNARAVREAAMDLYRAMRRANPDAWAEIDEVEDWAYWDDIVRTAQVTPAAARAETTTGAIARGEALAAGDPDWMNVTRWPRAETTTEDVLDSLPYFTFEDDDVAPDEEFVRKADVARLLATARTRPTRDDLILALAQADGQAWPDGMDDHTAEHMYGKQADEVLALLSDQPDPADVWDEAVEKIREQHPACEDPCEMCAEMDDWLTALADNPYRGGDE